MKVSDSHTLNAAQQLNIPEADFAIKALRNTMGMELLLLKPIFLLIEVRVRLSISL